MIPIIGSTGKVPESFSRAQRELLAFSYAQQHELLDVGRGA
jgi:hypothetical protein